MAAVVTTPVMFGLGYAIYRLLLQRLSGAPPSMTVLLTFGLAMVIEQGLRIVFGATPLPFSIPSELRGQILVGDFIYSRYRLFILLIAAGVLLGVYGARPRRRSCMPRRGRFVTGMRGGAGSGQAGGRQNQPAEAGGRVVSATTGAAGMGSVTARATVSEARCTRISYPPRCR